MKMAALWDMLSCSLGEADRLSIVRTASIIRAMGLIVLMMETVRTSETLVYFYETARCHIPTSHVQLISPKHFP